MGVRILKSQDVKFCCVFKLERRSENDLKVLGPSRDADPEQRTAIDMIETSLEQRNKVVYVI